MPTMRQIIENPEDEIVLKVPPECRDRRTEVISTRDPGIASFFGCLVEFPDRAPQGFSDLRLEDWEA